MKAEQIHNEGLRQTFRITILAQEIEKKTQEIINNYASEAKMPGFRLGKVPLKVIESRYRPKALKEAVSALVTQANQTVVKDNDLKVALQPKVELDTFEAGKDLSYTYDCEVYPSFETQPFNKMTFEKLATSVDDAAIDNALEEARRLYPNYKEITESRPAKENDYVHVRFTTKAGDRVVAHIDNISGSSVLGVRPFIFPEVDSLLMGATVGQEFTVEHTLPEAFPVPKFVGKKVVSHVVVTKIEEKVGYITVDDLVQKFALKNIDELRNGLKERIENSAKSYSRLMLKRGVLDALADQYKFPVPQGLVDTEFDIIWNRLQAEIEAARNKGELLEDDEEEKGEEELRQEYHSIAERRVRLGIVLSQIGQNNNIQLTENEMRSTLVHEASRYGDQAREVIDYYRKHPHALQKLLAPVLEDKVVDFIASSAKVEEKVIDFAAFKDAVRKIMPTAYSEEDVVEDPVEDASEEAVAAFTEGVSEETPGTKNPKVDVTDEGKAKGKPAAAKIAANESKTRKEVAAKPK